MAAGQELQLHRPPVGLLARASGSPAPPRRSAPTDTTAAARRACADTPATPAQPRLAARQRCHHRCAVAGATLRAAAAALNDAPALDQPHQLKRPCSPSLHLRSSMSGLLRRVCRRRPHPPSEAGRPPQPFTKSVGRSPGTAGRPSRACWLASRIGGSLCGRRLPRSPDRGALECRGAQGPRGAQGGFAGRPRSSADASGFAAPFQAACRWRIVRRAASTAPSKLKPSGCSWRMSSSCR